MALTFEKLEPGDFQPTSIEGGLPKLVRIWEHLRDLNTGGYGGAVLVDVKGATSKGKTGVTSCSPFTATCIYMALDPRSFDPGQPWSPKEPYEPLFDGGKPLDVNFYRLHNGFSLSSYASVKDKKFAGWKADFKQRYVDRMPQLAGDFSAFNFINHSAGSVIALNLGKRVDPKKMRRGDMVGIDWHNGHGHATFCWNVHLNAQGEVDCFQFISSNGTEAGGAGITIFRYPDVDPAYLEKSGGKYKKKKDMFSGIIEDPRAYPEYIQKPYWWFGLPGVKKGQIDLDSFGVPAKSVQVSYADSMDVSVSVVHVSRLHGITPPEPYLRADGGKTPEPEEDSKPAPLAKARATKADAAPQGAAAQGAMEKATPAPPHPVQEELEGHLQTLWKARWISKDPGDPGSVNDPESQAAIRSYQETFMKGDVPQLGHADPKTRARIAKAAASAAAMPMVNAALHLAHEHGEIGSAPGTEPMQLDDLTRAAVKDFQRKKGLDPDGIPGPLTQEKLSAYMKEAAKSAPPKGAQEHHDEKSENAPAGLVVCYFPRNHGSKGKPLTVNIKTTPAPDFSGKSYSVTLLSKDGKEVAKDAGKITIVDGKGSVDVPLPSSVGPGSVLKAKCSGNGLTAEVWGEYTVVPPTEKPQPEAAEMHWGIDYAVIDANKHPDWEKAKKEGPLSFVLIRATWGRHVDSNYHRDWEASGNAGLTRGAYMFLRFLPYKGDPPEEPDVQANAFVEAVGQLAKTDFPPSIDVEFDLQKTGKTPQQCLEWVRTAWNIVRSAYRVAPMIYTSTRVWAEELKDQDAPDLVESPLWLAKPYIYGRGAPARMDASAFAGTRNDPARYQDGMFNQKWPPAVPKPWGDAGNWWIHQYHGDASKFPGFNQVDVNRFHSMVKGATGDRVKWVQRRLGIDESGTFDDAMFDKLTEHQKKSGLDPSGIIGPSTFATLCWLNGEK